MITVAVLLPAYNCEKYLREAIDSILSQSFKDFHFYILNDGSTDTTEEIILSYSDKRINYIKNESNKGLIYTLNKGLELIQADYLLRMDADDIAMPERITKQVAFMEQYKDIIVCGTQTRCFGDVNAETSLPLCHDEIKTGLLFTNCIAHPTVILRLNRIKQYQLKYDSDFIHIEDYELWVRVAKLGKLANMNEQLLNYRMEGQNITINNWSTRELGWKKVYQKLFTELAISVNEENLKLHIQLSGNSQSISKVAVLKSYSKMLIDKNRITNIYKTEQLNKTIRQLWKPLFFKVVENGIIETINYWMYTKSISASQLRYIVGRYKSKFVK